jgi:hypothetical protein
MSERIGIARRGLRWLYPLLPLLLVNVRVVHAATVNISGSVMGTASVDLVGRCAPFPTVSATGSGMATGLGNFVDSQSHCTNGNFSFNQGMFELTSTDTPGNSLFGTYTGTASLQNGLLDFTSTLLVTGGTGLFANESGTLLSSGALNEATSAFSASFSGSVGAVPEPSTSYLILVIITVISFIRISNPTRAPLGNPRTDRSRQE